MNSGDLIGVAVLLTGLAVAVVVYDKKKERDRKKKEANHANN